ncbi:MAG TPA: TetR/AcrR family transcriptional regulator [Caulobacter sp.]|nr:TetR/AcrR family transcriptional regulator [Caulobacter sp.]
MDEPTGQNPLAAAMAMAMAALPPPPPVDGRRLRAEANRARIVAAMLELIREGYMTPPAEAVAERAGVGLRTVFRLFNDMDGLYREMHAMMLSRLAPIAAEPVVGADWRERLRNLIHRRVRLFEEMMPYQVAADAHRARSPFLQKEHQNLVRLQRYLATALLPEDIQADVQLVEMVDLAMSFDAWRRLRLDQGQTPEQAEAIVAELVFRAIGP